LLAYVGHNDKTIFKGRYNFSYDHNLGLFAARGTYYMPLQPKLINMRFFESTADGILYTYSSDTKECLVSR